ncbi:MAG: glycosyltransferase family 9 protein [Acidobacteria bacterium]|nr:glycosyltransferase family 9 protein [Acidobacteriota bacterium]
MSAIPRGAVWVRVPRFVGDAVMIHAAIAPLRATGLPLVLWGPGWVLDLFEGSSDYAAVFPEPTRKYSPLQAAAMLRTHRPAALVNFPKSIRPLAAALLAGVPLRLGCGDRGASLLCSHSVAFYRQDTPFVDRYASVVHRAFPGLPHDPPFRPFQPRAEALEAAARERSTLGLGPYAVFALGANSWSKRLSLDAYADLGRALEGRGIRSVVLGAGAEDQRLADELAARFPSVLSQVGRGGMAYAAAWVCGAEVLVGGDSGLTHLGGICGIPVLAVYGPTRPRHSAPVGPQVTVLRKEPLDCLECMRGDCPVEGHPCMNGLEHGQLLGALLSLLRSGPGQ